ncbi:MAG: reverse transcriptase domain-containing protein [Tsuneonella suprasediminis]
MAVRFATYDYNYQKNGKWYYAPSDKGREIGLDLKEQIEAAYPLDGIYYHLHDGGHVAALHQHRPHRYFCRVDIENFFYRIARNRVARALRGIGIARAERYAKWSTVKDPFGEFNYVIPYGFIQSPILATLVLDRSAVGNFLRSIPIQIGRSVYMDDIILSGDNLEMLTQYFDQLKAELKRGNFRLSQRKIRPPSEAMDVFNCDLETGQSAVQQDRREKFFAEPRSQESIEAFEEYCDRVETGNSP